MAIECPICADRNGIWGLGAIDDPESNAAGGTPWRECFECGGTGYLVELMEPIDILKEMVNEMEASMDDPTTQFEFRRKTKR